MQQNMNLSMTPYTQAGAFVCSQYDVGRTCQIKLVDESGDYAIPTGATVTVMATKPSGLGFAVACTWSGSTVTFVTTETMTNEFGRFPAEIRVTSGDTVLGTTNFFFKVERSPHPEGTVDGDAETIINQITLLVNRAEAAADAAVEQAQATIDEILDTIPQDIADLKSDLGDLTQLETTAKTDLVSAINEAAQSGSSDSGSYIDATNGELVIGSSALSDIEDQLASI